MLNGTVGLTSEISRFLQGRGKINWHSNVSSDLGVCLCEVEQTDWNPCLSIEDTGILYLRIIISGGCIFKGHTTDGIAHDVSLRKGDALLGFYGQDIYSKPWNSMTISDGSIVSLYLCIQQNNIDVELNMMLNELKKMKFNGSDLVLSDQHILHSMKSAKALLSDDYSYADSYLKSLASTLSLYWINKASKSQESINDVDMERKILRIKKLLCYIEKNLSCDLSLKKLAAQANVSMFYFARMFKDVVGVPPHAYVREQRLKKASYLLTSTDHSMTDIAELVGLSESQFFRSFLAEYRISPRHYRKQYQLVRRG